MTLGSRTGGIPGRSVPATFTSRRKGRLPLADVAEQPQDDEDQDDHTDDSESKHGSFLASELITAGHAMTVPPQRPPTVWRGRRYPHAPIRMLMRDALEPWSVTMAHSWHADSCALRASRCSVATIRNARPHRATSSAFAPAWRCHAMACHHLSGESVGRAQMRGMERTGIRRRVSVPTSVLLRMPAASLGRYG